MRSPGRIKVRHWRRDFLPPSEARSWYESAPNVFDLQLLRRAPTAQRKCKQSKRSYNRDTDFHKWTRKLIVLLKKSFFSQRLDATLRRARDRKPPQIIQRQSGETCPALLARDDFQKGQKKGILWARPRQPRDCSIMIINTDRLHFTLSESVQKLLPRLDSF